jgi:hypothetical protein
MERIIVQVTDSVAPCQNATTMFNELTKIGS